ncbi:MAG TPA: serine hydrolase domain-containing protein [Stellaceae bacterium]|jgi:CubicO group peptidase (beta-lactamase class C family)|nr:serine hydrolase domain-containing protein [Stellaceae bacterium]
MTSGLSKARLQRMHDVMAGHVERGLAPGVITLIERRGETHVDVIGNKALGGRDPMRRDTLFRITSMTKAITATAAMILVEECKLRLDEPVDRLLPELADRRVLKRLDGPLDDTVPAQRPISLRDLLTFRAGYGFVWGAADQFPILKAIAELEITGFGPPDQSTPIGPDEWLKRLATLPLIHQPGERWLYNTGSYILGVLIARASGQSFGEFLRERIFAPLGMKDTGFFVPPQKLDRLSTSYFANDKTAALDLLDAAQDSQWSRPPAFEDGGAGLVTTIDDYLAFARVLLNQGKHGETRLLSRPSVALMTTDQLTPAQKAASVFLADAWENRGWGVGVGIVTGRDNLAMTPGAYGWPGGYGTGWANDPAEEMIAILMTQRSQYPAFSPVYQDFWTSAYQAIDD